MTLGKFLNFSKACISFKNGGIATKRNEILIHATTWVSLENIMLSEISQTPKDKYCMIPLYEVPRIGKFIETESRRVISRGWECWVKGMGSYC